MKWLLAIFCVMALLLTGSQILRAEDGPTIVPAETNSRNPLAPVKTNDKSPIAPAKSNEKSPLDTPRENNKKPLKTAEESSGATPTKNAEEGNKRSPFAPTKGESVAPRKGSASIEPESGLPPKTNFTAAGIKKKKSSSAKSQELRGNRH